MKKSDLKTGMIIETNNGDIGMVMLGTQRGDIIAGDGRSDENLDRRFWCPLSEFDEELQREDNSSYKSIDKVYSLPGANMISASLTKDRKLLWERKRKINQQGKWLLNKNFKQTLFYVVKDNDEGYFGYGISVDGLWFDGKIGSNSDDVEIVEATDEEVLERLEQEARNRGLIKDVHITLSKNLYNASFGGTQRERITGDTYHFEDGNLYIKATNTHSCGICIMRSGEWAQLRGDVITRGEAEKVLGMEIID